MYYAYKSLKLLRKKVFSKKKCSSYFRCSQLNIVSFWSKSKRWGQVSKQPFSIWLCGDFEKLHAITDTYVCAHCSLLEGTFLHVHVYWGPPTLANRPPLCQLISTSARCIVTLCKSIYIGIGESGDPKLRHRSWRKNTQGQQINESLLKSVR